MYSQSDIEDAVAGGALTAEQAASLRNHVAARNGTPTADEEPVRWLLGFNDLYVFYSSILLLVGLGWLGSKIDIGNSPSPFMAIFVAAGAWGLAEFFSRRKRQALSGIGFAVTFVYAVFFAGMLLAVSMMGRSNIDSMNIINAVCALLGAGGAFLYWKRFEEPIAVSLGVGMVAMAIMFLLGAAVPTDPGSDIAEIVLLVLGLAVFVYAMMWDSKDPRRVTRRADTGFWLHWTSTWMVIIALVALLKLAEGPVSVVMSVVTILLFIVLTLVALAVDRRVWVLGAAYPLGVGLFWLINGQPRRFEDMDSYGGGYDSMGGAYGGGYGGGYGGYGNTQDSLMITLLLIGILLVVIGMFWSQIRRSVVGMLPEGLRNRVPGTDLQPVREAQTFD
ncbi:MAG TPA: hypothetical protein VMS43_16850 [Allosphingosinicella sp.]|nr:hypothetical protein [Allosphingosinicella sp.]